ncbi:MAG: hypothetical protein JO340_07025 [Acidobacteriaceae bacterium]|nr:hypothetical protein [Acidobacteriaceae bacterium]
MSMAELGAGAHPRAEILALYATGDLPWRLRWRTRSHVRRCGDCEQQALLFRSARAELKREAETETLTGFEAIADLGRLEREMLGNIAVGVAAARCIDNAGRTRGLFSKGALAAALMALFAAGWLTHIPKEETAQLTASARRVFGWERPQASGTVLRTMPDGIAVRAQGATLMMMHPRSAVVSVSGASAVEARYVDEETGQVTITNVYGQ